MRRVCIASARRWHSRTQGARTRTFAAGAPQGGAAHTCTAEREFIQAPYIHAPALGLEMGMASAVVRNEGVPGLRSCRRRLITLLPCIPPGAGQETRLALAQRGLEGLGWRLLAAGDAAALRGSGLEQAPAHTGPVLASACCCFPKPSPPSAHEMHSGWLGSRNERRQGRHHQRTPTQCYCAACANSATWVARTLAGENACGRQCSLLLYEAAARASREISRT